ncbi:MAG: hypothetical protein MZV64_71400 [Ignavibacteriales bacterium]|nr:hypothetical protein [Ignavibacteriales bacterium]
MRENGKPDPAHLEGHVGGMDLLPVPGERSHSQFPQERERRETSQLRRLPAELQGPGAGGEAPPRQGVHL